MTAKQLILLLRLYAGECPEEVGDSFGILLSQGLLKVERREGMSYKLSLNGETLVEAVLDIAEHPGSDRDGSGDDRICECGRAYSRAPLW